MKEGITIDQKLQDKGSEDRPGPGVYKEKLHIVEGPHI